MLHCGFIYFEGECNLIDNCYLENHEELFGIATNDIVFVVWSTRSWFTFSFDGVLLSSNLVPHSKDDANIVHIYLGAKSNREHFIVWKYGYSTGVASNIEMFLSPTFGIDNEGFRNFAFHSGIVMTQDRRNIFACKEEKSFKIFRYK